MPVQSVWMIRLSLVYFFTAVMTGAILLVHKAVDLHPALWEVLPLHFEMAIWGWLIQFIMGTAYWMFPRLLNVPKRGPAKAAWFVILIFNSGIFLVLISHFQQSGEWIRFSGRFVILAGILTFIRLMWNRVTSYRNFTE